MSGKVLWQRGDHSGGGTVIMERDGSTGKNLLYALGGAVGGYVFKSAVDGDLGRNNHHNHNNCSNPSYPGYPAPYPAPYVYPAHGNDCDTRKLAEKDAKIAKLEANEHTAHVVVGVVKEFTDKYEHLSGKVCRQGEELAALGVHVADTEKCINKDMRYLKEQIIEGDKESKRYTDCGLAWKIDMQRNVIGKRHIWEPVKCDCEETDTTSTGG